MPTANKIKKSAQRAPHFPHFSRIFAALFFFFLLLASFPLPPGEKLKLITMQDSQNPKVHLQLAKEYKRVNDLENARRELLIGLSFGPDEEELKRELEEVENLLAQPDRILGEIREWEEIAQEFPGFRDAYLKLASLYYQTYQNKKAQENLKRALELDPNFTPARKLEEILRD